MNSGIEKKIDKIKKFIKLLNNSKLFPPKIKQTTKDNLIAFLRDIKNTDQYFIRSRIRLDFLKSSKSNLGKSGLSDKKFRIKFTELEILLAENQLKDAESKRKKMLYKLDKRIALIEMKFQRYY